MHLREFEAADLPTVKEWAAARGITIIPELLSPNGFMVEDEHGPCAVIWVYLFYGVPVAQLDNFFTRPGLRGRRVLRLWARLFEVVKTFLKELKDPDGQPMGYRILRVFCVPGAVPNAKRSGWHVSPGQYNQTFYIL